MRIIAGKYKNRVLKTPKGMNTRPTSEKLRGAVFNMVQNAVEGSRFLDLYAGSGAIGIEALSRGAVQAVFIDQSAASMEAISRNIDALQLASCTQSFKGDVFLHLNKLEQRGSQFDIIYADPPYSNLSEEGEPTGLKLLRAIDAGSLLKEGGIFFLEETQELSIDPTYCSRLVLLKQKSFGQASLHQFLRPKGK